jgi:hypothetical protein
MSTLTRAELVELNTLLRKVVLGLS